VKDRMGDEEGPERGKVREGREGGKEERRKKYGEGRTGTTQWREL
jgi:hypothetical protein